MNNYQSEKIFSKSRKSKNIKELQPHHVTQYSEFFKVYRRDNTPTAINYFLGLIVCEKGKANMERMNEEIPESDYRAYQHFISNSNWDYKGLMSKMAKDASELFASNKAQKGFPTGYLIDESAHMKKGDKSVGVANQYAGIVGKVELSNRCIFFSCK